MIATYHGLTDHVIESLRGEDGLYHATIDGQASSITAKYKTVAIKRAVRACQEQEQQIKKEIQP